MFHVLAFYSGEYCKMVDREGKQVLMCTWGKSEPSTVELDFAPFYDDQPKQEASNQVLKKLMSV